MLPSYIMWVVQLISGKTIEEDDLNNLATLMILRLMRMLLILPKIKVKWLNVTLLLLDFLRTS